MVMANDDRITGHAFFHFLLGTVFIAMRGLPLFGGPANFLFFPGIGFIFTGCVLLAKRKYNIFVILLDIILAIASAVTIMEMLGVPL
jgi:hypothetical protein